LTGPPGLQLVVTDEELEELLDDELLLVTDDELDGTALLEELLVATLEELATLDELVSPLLPAA
jgi:hypothetical protein